MERLALTNNKKIPKRKISVKDNIINLSGVENIAEKLYSETSDKPLTAAFVLDYIGRALCALAENYELKNGKTRFVFGGGVMCNSIIKSMINERFDACFAEPQLSADNAVGIAALVGHTHGKLAAD